MTNIYVCLIITRNYLCLLVLESKMLNVKYLRYFTLMDPYPLNVFQLVGSNFTTVSNLIFIWM